MKNIFDRFLEVLAFIVIYSINCVGQESDLALPQIDLTTITQVNQGNSYCTFPTDIGNIEPLWFEGNLTPNFYIRQSKNSRLLGVFTPQVIIRMYQKESKPVRTPSYIPQFTAYYHLKSKTNLNILSIFGRLAHHSNGQDGSFYLENGDINTKSGDFYTNYLELGLIKTNFNPFFRATQFIGTSVQFHPKEFTKENLYGSYSRLRWNTTFSIFKLKGNSNENEIEFSFKGKFTWMFGDIYDWDYYSMDRLNLSLTFFYHPKFLEDIGLFTQVYHGMDYYNIYFNHKISIIRFGIMTENLRF